ncbi:cytochrome c family protein [Croceicoccus sp. F390]|uniref:Cytochrome c family protein n=1 Tax=Croceicoccus esteveae TaxID=3075597 RepID=A0ABU2ZK92_9SPHN|nr:cytochrome c family protein [Croceicoccus sp. F390]MDT0575822.1 cytochrome c family protein [Croceicoccus sp. F390]
MDDKFNTIAGWTLFGGVIALGLSAVSSRVFEADRPETDEFGYIIEAAEDGGAAEEGPSLAVLLASADPVAGEAVFAKCTACHTIAQGGANGIGPNLYGVMGLPIGKHVAGFAYSSALSGHGGDWNFENMDAWLKSPRAFADGTKMSFAGLSKPEDRANIIAYLNMQGSNLPYPAVEAEAESPEGEPGDGDTTGVSASPAGSMGPIDKVTPAAAGAMAQPALKPSGGDDPTGDVE